MRRALLLRKLNNPGGQPPLIKYSLVSSELKPQSLENRSGEIFAGFEVGRARPAHVLDRDGFERPGGLVAGENVEVNMGIHHHQHEIVDPVISDGFGKELFDIGRHGRQLRMSGRRQIVALRFPGDGILPREGSAEYGIQAIVKSEVMIGKAEDFDPIVEANPELARFFWKLIQRHNSIGYEWLVNTGRRDSTARVAHLLCETAERSGIDASKDGMVNPFTQQQIADITGQTSVNVNRVFADLERQGLIKRRGREIIFSDWNELRRVASFQPGYLQ